MGAGASSGCGEVALQAGEQRRRDCGQQLSQVGTGGGQNEVHGVAGQTLQEAAAQAMVAFQVTDLRFDRAATLAAFLLRASQVAGAGARDVDRRIAVVVVSAIVACPRVVVRGL